MTDESLMRHPGAAVRYVLMVGGDRDGERRAVPAGEPPPPVLLRPRHKTAGTDAGPAWFDEYLLEEVIGQKVASNQLVLEPVAYVYVCTDGLHGVPRGQLLRRLLERYPAPLPAALEWLLPGLDFVERRLEASVGRDGEWAQVTRVADQLTPADVRAAIVAARDLAKALQRELSRLDAEQQRKLVVTRLGPWAPPKPPLPEKG